MNAHDLIERGLLNHVGRQNAITNNEIRAALRSKGVVLSQAEVRDIIHDLRKRKLFIVGDNSGYYIASTSYEREQWLKTMSSRIREMQDVYRELLQVHSNKSQQITINYE